MTCAYKNCLHKNIDSSISEMVQNGKKYYHADCLKTKDEINKITILFAEKINKNVVFAQLVAVINNIVFKKSISSEFLLFGLNYYIDHKIPLNYPQGLYYVIQNKDVQKAYDKLKVQSQNNKVEITESSEDGFTFKPTKAKGFADIIGK